MTLIRNWQGLDQSPTEGQKTIHEIGWKRVLVKRTDDFRQDVGTGSELTDDTDTFEIKARIDPMTATENGKTWIGLVEPHILPLMRKGDRWFTEKPTGNQIQVYRVMSIDADEVILDREL